jgi:hypothetical protein
VDTNLTNVKTIGDAYIRTYMDNQNQLLVIEIPSAKQNKNVNLILFNNIGQQVKTISKLSSDINKVDVSDLPSGNYFVKISDSDIVTTKKIVKF